MDAMQILVKIGRVVGKLPGDPCSTSFDPFLDMLIMYSYVSGKKKVCLDTQYEYVYELLEKRLWDEPNKVKTTCWGISHWLGSGLGSGV